MVLPSLCLYLVLLLIICEVCKGFYSGAWGQLSSDRAIPRLNSIYKQRQSRNILAAAKEVTAEELELEFQDWETPMLLDVFATWCGPCQLLMPELDRLDTMLGEGKMRILKLDSEKYPQIAGAFRVRGLPTLLFMKDGQLTGRIEGALPAEELVKLVDHLCFGGPAPDLEGDIREVDE